ncbi:phytosulfokines-like [Cucurbita pepo subsp. pepo]|uniref:phytosulfokines-like n=1 Tax=Cucurbita pepo subsp. pepo TaxID=3664 RepID=UPI000C9D93A0|nr:phytosulfokines-like [Cucurbita pepo subsp. pepo]
MSKLVSLFSIVALVTMSLLSFSEARPIATSTATFLDLNHIAHQVVSEKSHDDVCEGGETMECLARSTFEAHTDYIYTDDTKS